MIGGGVTTPATRDYVGADFQTIDAMAGVAYCMKIVKGRINMPEETMTSNERVAAAIRLDKPDRVPVVPLLPPEPIAHLAGLTQGQVAADCSVTLSGLFKVYDAIRRMGCRIWRCHHT